MVSFFGEEAEINVTTERFFPIYVRPERGGGNVYFLLNMNFLELAIATPDILLPSCLS